MKNFCPVTPSIRHKRLISREKLTAKKFLKSKRIKLQNRSGRNNTGKITCFHRGKGHKKLYRNIEFFPIGKKGFVTSIEHDPYRTAFISQIFNPELLTRYYLLTPQNVKIGQLIDNTDNNEIKVGNSLPLSKIPIGTSIHNLSYSAKKVGQLSRSAGTSSLIVQKTKKKVLVKLPSGKKCYFPASSFGTIGIVSNSNHNLEISGKAGRSRWLNHRPIVRGVAMNPVDHPHGGGEGKSSGGRPSVTPWGKPTQGQPTSRKR